MIFQSTQTQRTPDWVIVVSVLGAVLFIAVLAVIVVAIIKMQVYSVKPSCNFVKS